MLRLIKKLFRRRRKRWVGVDLGRGDDQTVGVEIGTKSIYAKMPLDTGTIRRPVQHELDEQTQKAAKYMKRRIEEQMALDRNPEQWN